LTQQIFPPMVQRHSTFISLHMVLTTEPWSTWIIEPGRQHLVFLSSQEMGKGKKILDLNLLSCSGSHCFLALVLTDTTSSSLIWFLCSRSFCSFLLCTVVSPPFSPTHCLFSHVKPQSLNLHLPGN
jgi:hypothetical protein